jgi:hypothetical protein
MQLDLEKKNYDLIFLIELVENLIIFLTILIS